MRRAPERWPMTSPSASRLILGSRAIGCRRTFLGTFSGVVAATMAAGAIGLEPLIATKSAVAHASDDDSGERAEQSFKIRLKAARKERNLPIPLHTTNGDEALYPNRIGNFCKGLPHNGIGLVDPGAYRSLLDALASDRSEEHTSELQSRLHLVCRLLLEKKKTNSNKA